MINLTEADILLYEGKDWLSQAIKKFDGTPMSHAALYLGGNTVGEAQLQGVIKRNLQESVGKTRVTAYRLKARPDDMKPVLEVAEYYLNQHERYAFEQIFLLAFICLTRQLKYTPILNRVLEQILSLAGSLLSKLVSGGKEPMICSEFVYRAYDEVKVPDKSLYAIEILRLAAISRGMKLKAETALPSKSLLFKLTSSPRQMITSAQRLKAAELPLAQQTAELKKSLQQYFSEIEQTVPVKSQAELEIVPDRLQEAFNTFAARYYLACHKDAGLKIERMAEEKLTSGTRDFISQQAANWVTPGDLYRSPGLYAVGQVK